MTGHQSTSLTSPGRGVISLIRRGSLAWYGEELDSQSSCVIAGLLGVESCTGLQYRGFIDPTEMYLRSLSFINFIIYLFICM